MKYTKPRKYVFGERPARPPYGPQVFTEITHRANIFDVKTGKRRIMADMWNVYVHITPSRVRLIGRVRRTKAGYSAQTIAFGQTSKWFDVRSVAAAKREALKRVGIAA